MRDPVFWLSWLKRTVLRLTALYSLTGTVTSPKLMAPVQIERGMDRQVCRRMRNLHTRRRRSCAPGSAAEVPQAPPLGAVGVEVRGVQPGLEGGTRRGPLAVQQREPGRVAVAAL